MSKLNTLRNEEMEASDDDDNSGIIILPTLSDEQLQEQAQNRVVGSLVLLTQKFVKLMKENNGEIDLKDATELLDFKKRRIYDITNVLEGVGLIEKTRHSSVVKWKGGDFGHDDDGGRLQSILARSNQLIAVEADLDLQLEYARRNLRHLRDDDVNKSYAYVTRDDLRTTFGDDIVITIPNHDKEVQIFQTDYDLHVSLDNGSIIDIRLVTNQGQTFKEANIEKQRNLRYETPSPSELSISEPSMSPTSTTNIQANNGDKLNKDLVADEHTYFCNPLAAEQKDEMEQIERELTAKILFRHSFDDYSLRRLYPDDPDLENPPLVQLNPPQNDFNFVLSPNEGVIEVFNIPTDDIPCL